MILIGFYIGVFVTGVSLTALYQVYLNAAVKRAYEEGQYSIARLSAAEHRARQEFEAMRETSALSNLN